MHHVYGLARELLGLAEDTIVVCGDATECKSSCPLGSAPPSVYKATDAHNHTITTLGIGATCVGSPKAAQGGRATPSCTWSTLPVGGIAHGCGDA